MAKQRWCGYTAVTRHDGGLRQGGTSTAATQHERDDNFQVDIEVGQQPYQQPNDDPLPASLQYLRLSDTHRHPPRITPFANPLSVLDCLPC